jgi:3-hydroxyacyl-[acyl-carrier-protein] dehydratase
MRWIWIDKFLEFESGKRAVSLKNVTLAEEHLHDHFPGFPVMPECLMIEAMAQTAGILVGEARQFQEKVILPRLKAPCFIIMQPAIRSYSVPKLNHAGSRQHGRANQTRHLIKQINFTFSHIDKNLGGKQFPEENFVFTDMFNS